MPTSSDAEWYFARDGQQNGPFDIATMRSMIAAGQVQSTDLAWRAGMSDWIAVSVVSDFKTGPAAVPNPQAYRPQQQSYSSPAGNGPNQGYASPATPNYGQNVAQGPSQQPLAIIGFILAFVFPLAGIILCIIALNGMKTHRNNEGKGLAKAGLIISIAWFVLGCLWFLMIFAFMGAAASHGVH